MSFLRRVVLIAAIAALAVVPLRAFGVVGADAPSALSVSASLGGCGVGGGGIVCTIDVAFTGVEGADYYTGTLTRADGSVQDLGTIGSGEGGGGASVSVPYVGAGTYSVTVSAWGEPDDEGKGEEPELLDRERAEAGDEDEGAGEVSAEPADEEGAGEDEDADAGDASEPPADGAAEPDEEPAPQALPECRPDEPQAATPTEGGAETEAATPAPPPAPVVECRTPSSDANGPCCPPGT